MPELEDLSPDPKIRCTEYRIGCIGAGFIMADVQLAAYRRAGFPVIGISSRSEAHAKQVAARWDIPRVHPTPGELIEDPEIQIVDIAFPPDQQPELIRLALRQPHVLGILAQKPLAMDFATARALAEEVSQSDKVVSVNQNMRFDQSMRVLKQLLMRGDLGKPVIGTIEMRAVPHWQPFLAQYDRLTLLNMSVHHLDVLRFLFGEPIDIFTASRPDPRTKFAHRDGICVSTLRFENGTLAVSLEDVWSGPREEGFESDIYIRWRVEGTEGLATGTIGWPDYPAGSPSTLKFNSRKTTGGKWVQPTWETRWFPDAFAGVMDQLQYAIKSGTTPELSMSDNLRTMALVEAAYRSLEESRAVRLEELFANP
ncbi:MAG: Gfo/Idh/MocA family oxidoreductase [Verrucomicrobia bacterium]|nr:Gfo/Idh/MocA family oxidoreductase [Verrucomicrobiota bacterium]